MRRLSLRTRLSEGLGLRRLLRLPGARREEERARLKIVLVTEKYHPYENGGPERSVRALAQGLLELGHEPVVVTFSAKRHNEIRHVQGVKVHYVGHPDFDWLAANEKRPEWKNFLLHLRSAASRRIVAQIDRIVSGEQPAIVHTSSLRGVGVSLWRTLQVRSVPVVHTLRDCHLACSFPHSHGEDHSRALRCLRCRPFAALYRRASAHVDGVAGNSRFMLAEHVRRGFFPNASVTAVIFPPSQTLETVARTPRKTSVMPLTPRAFAEEYESLYQRVRNQKPAVTARRRALPRRGVPEYAV